MSTRRAITFRARLRGELLEARETPSSVWSLEDFESTTIGSIPANWRTWSSSNSPAFYVQNQRAFQSAHGLATATLSTTTARAWQADLLPANFGVSTHLYLDHMQPVQVFARGRNLDSSTPTYYAVSIQRGLQAQLLKVVGGTSTVLATIKSQGYFSGTWVQVSLLLDGNKLAAQIARPDTGQFLNSAGAWDDSPALALTANDSAIFADGFAGIHRPAQTAVPIHFDNFTILGPDRVRESFDQAPLGSQPAGWSRWTNLAGGGFATTNQLSQSPQQSLQSNSTLSQGSGRAWVSTIRAEDVQVSASVYLSNLIPAELFARGSNLDGTSPTYYALSILRGVQVKLLRVVNGVVSELGIVKSNSYLSGQWVQAKLTVLGDQIQASVYRSDTGQFLDANGNWTDTPTRALSRTDSAIRGAGFTGVNRPVSYAGSVTLDDFEMQVVSGDSQGPAVSIRSPASGATLTGRVTIQADASDAGGIDRVEFLIDNVLRFATAHSPFQWTFDTLGLANGTHTITVRAHDLAGNIGEDSIVVTVENETPARPNIPRHYNHIRIASLAYNGTPLTTFEKGLLRNSIDVVIPHPRYLSTIDAESPNTPQLIYTNVSNLYEQLLTDWLTYADANGHDRELAFYHAAKPTAWTGASASSRPVNWFWSVLRGSSLSSFVNLTSAASNSTAGDVTFGGLGESLYLGFPERFRELNVNLYRAAAGGWNGVLEYATATDANGLPTAWKTLPTTLNSTAGFTRSGTIAFDPPADWKTARLNNLAPMYFIRIRTTANGTAPIATSLLGRDYVQARGGTSGTIPVFDSAADLDGDGYLNDAEYARRSAGKDARFLYESRIFYPYYGQMRFVTNPSSVAVQDWAADYHYRFLQANPLADGLFVDNSGGRSPLLGYSTVESMSDYTDSYASMLATINKRIAPRWLAPNTSGGGAETDAVIRTTPMSIEEFAIRPLAHNWQQFDDLAALVSRRQSLVTPSPYLVLDSHPSGGSPTDPRTQISTLAYYYLLADPDSTFLMFFGGNEPSTSWTRHWVQAAAYDIGRPTAAWSQFATGADPINAALTYRIYQRSYANALVLYKPLSYAQGKGAGTLSDATATTHLLNGTYRLLRADGTLSGPVTSVTLRNGEGAVLIKA